MAFQGRIVGMLTSLKNRLLQLGPESPLLLFAFRLQAKMHGIRMNVADGKILLTRGQQKMILSGQHPIFVPFAVHSWTMFFDDIVGETRDGQTVLDFSVPGLHRYRKTGLSFHFPSFAEDDCMDAYTAAYSPKSGDIVWDVGAHAGATAYFLAQMVGPEGKVYAFEPDETGYEFLVRNIELHQLSNVIPVKAALSATTGTATFCMDGTMGAGLSDSLQYISSENTKTVETLSLQDACERFGSVPNYMKIDIEGAELNVVESSLDFLRSHPINLAIESNHVVNGTLTSGPLDRILGEAGYRVWSSDKYGQRFTWAQPAQRQQQPN
jgi:FkbM family methyltransferase